MKVAYAFMGMPVGGAEDFAVGLARSLRGRGVEPSFVCLRSLDVVGEELREAGEDVTLLRCAPSRRFSPWGVVRLAGWLRARGVEVVQSTTYHAHTYAVPAGKLAGCRVVLRQAKTLDKNLKRHWVWTYRNLGRLIDAYVALSEKTARDIHRVLGIAREKIRVVPNAVDGREFFAVGVEERRRLRRELGLGEEGFWYGTVGSLHEVKNGVATVEALARCRERHPNLDMRVVFVGDGEERWRLEGLVRERGLEGRVVFAGRRRPVGPWVRALDGFVLPSFWEGQSLALLQALSCGLPVLASRIEGNVAVLGEEHPGLFAPRDVETYAGLMAQLVLDGEFGAEVRNYQSELRLPCWEETVGKYLAIYREVTGAVGGGR